MHFPFGTSTAHPFPCPEPCPLHQVHRTQRCPGLGEELSQDQERLPDGCPQTWQHIICVPPQPRANFPGHTLHCSPIQGSSMSWIRSWYPSQNSRSPLSAPEKKTAVRFHSDKKKIRAKLTAARRSLVHIRHEAFSSKVKTHPKACFPLHHRCVGVKGQRPGATF